MSRQWKQRPTPQAPESNSPVIIEVRRGPISLDEILAAMQQPRTTSDGPATDIEVGALVTFSGLVRGSEDGRPISHLGYEHYAGMAESQMRQLGEDASARWPIRALALVHRIGEVPAGEPSVIVAVAAGHRAESFEAARFLIDELKARVPIWKAAPP